MNFHTGIISQTVN